MIDRNTGKLYTNDLLDSEEKAIYELIVRASNDEPDDTVIRYRRRRQVEESSILRVKIVVGDINDEAPVFLGEPYYGCKYKIVFGHSKMVWTESSCGPVSLL